MKPTCPKCNSENLTQGVDKKILCNDCKHFFEIIPSALRLIPDIEDLK